MAAAQNHKSPARTKDVEAAIDAAVVVHFAKVMKPEVRQLQDAACWELSALLPVIDGCRDSDRRIQLTGSRVKIGPQVVRLSAAVAKKTNLR
jgi:hypothetical protein